MKEEIKNQYLKEDQDILDELNSIKPFYVGQDHQQNLASLQIKSILRNRKTMVNLDQSNKKYSRVIGLFAIIQIVIAGFALVLAIKNSPDETFSIFIGLLFIIILVWLVKEGDKIMSD
jgi:hypothetical protein